MEPSDSQYSTSSYPAVQFQNNLRKNDDFLSFLSLFVSTIRDMSTDLQLASILLGSAIDLQDPVNAGSFFSVTLIEQHELSQYMPISPEKLSPLPRVVALKKPLLKGDVKSPSNLRVLSSMAMELQILRDEYLRSHDNIVSLLGMCWQVDSEQQVLPVFVLEATEIGDLNVFLSGRALNASVEVRLCMDIAFGLQALHEKGVVHGDIKPENVLIFKNGQGSVIAKLCDFGSSLLMSTLQSGRTLPGGTKAWQAPEIHEVFKPEALQRAEVYSLGLAMWYIFAHDIVDAVLKSDLPSLNANKASGDLLHTAIETLESQYTEEWQLENSTELHLRQCTLSSTLAPLADERWDIAAVLCCLLELMELTVTREHNEIQGPNDIERAGPDAYLERGSFPEEPVSAIPSGKGKEPANWQAGEIPQSGPSSQADQQSHLETPASAWIQDDRDEDGVFDASRSFATVQLFPSAVLDELKTQLELVASTHTESLSRRAKAAFQYANITINWLRCTSAASTETDKPLALLRQAASFGNQQAQSLVNWLHEALNQEVPFSPDIEIPWLVNGTIHGSMTARKRLETLDGKEFKRAMGILRRKYAGLGVEFEFDEEGLDTAISLNLTGSRHLFQRMLHSLAYLGRTDDCQRVLSLGFYNVNETDDWGETPLLVACRSGNSQLVELLLDSGADPRIASIENLTPLHFLSAFDESEIPSIAKRFFDCHADLEARSTLGKRFNIKLDCQFGLVEGTPLLWAIAARSLIATRTLVELGADPFDLQGVGLPVSKSFGNNVHLSPVDYAARIHQYRFLEVMLGHSQTHLGRDCAWILNNNFRSVAPYPEFAALPMFWAIEYLSEGLLYNLLLHGNDHEVVCTRTVQTLIDYGANPSEVNNQGQNALDIASSQGQPFLMAYLLQHVHNPSDLSPRQFLEVLFNTVRANDFISFNLLVDQSREINLDGDLANHYFALTAESTDNVSFIDFYLDNQIWGPRSNKDDSEVFERAILRGNFASARRIFENGHVNLKNRMVNAKDNESTLFGRLIVRAKKYHNAVDKIQFFLSLTGGADDLFYNVLQVQDMELTAFHASCLFAEYRPDLAASATGNVMDALLACYNEAHHLNAQVFGGQYAGFTPLHLAVDGGNLAAAHRLLQEKGKINTEILNSQGETAFDLVKKRWRNQARFMTDVPAERQLAYKEGHDKTTYELDRLMVRAGARCRRYMSLVRKINETTILMDVFGSEAGPELIPLTTTNLRFLDEALSGAAKEASNLKPDHTFLISTGDQTLMAENEARGQSDAFSLANTATNSDSRAFLETISHPLSRLRVVKTSMDTELSDLCDFLRKS